MRTAGGNTLINALLEAKLPSGGRPGAQATSAETELFVQRKYVERRWSSEEHADVAGMQQVDLGDANADASDANDTNGATADPHTGMAVSTNPIAMQEFAGILLIRLKWANKLPKSDFVTESDSYVIMRIREMSAAGGKAAAAAAARDGEKKTRTTRPAEGGGGGGGGKAGGGGGGSGRGSGPASAAASALPVTPDPVHGPQMARSSTVDNSANPEWNEKFTLNFIDVENEELCIEVWDGDTLGSDELLGTASLPLSMLPPSKNVQVGGRDGWMDWNRGRFSLFFFFPPVDFPTPVSPFPLAFFSPQVILPLENVLAHQGFVFSCLCLGHKRRNDASVTMGLTLNKLE